MSSINFSLSQLLRSLGRGGGGAGGSSSAAKGSGKRTAAGSGPNTPASGTPLSSKRPKLKEEIPPAPPARGSNRLGQTTEARGTSLTMGSAKSNLLAHLSRRDQFSIAGRTITVACGLKTPILKAAKKSPKISQNSSPTRNKKAAPPRPSFEGGSVFDEEPPSVPSTVQVGDTSGSEGGNGGDPQAKKPSNPREAPGDGRTAPGIPKTSSAANLTNRWVKPPRTLGCHLLANSAGGQLEAWGLLENLSPLQLRRSDLPTFHLVPPRLLARRRKGAHDG